MLGVCWECMYCEYTGSILGVHMLPVHSQYIPVYPSMETRGMEGYEGRVTVQYRYIHRTEGRRGGGMERRMVGRRLGSCTSETRG